MVELGDQITASDRSDHLTFPYETRQSVFPGFPTLGTVGPGSDKMILHGALAQMDTPRDHCGRVRRNIGEILSVAKQFSKQVVSGLRCSTNRFRLWIVLWSHDVILEF